MLVVLTWIYNYLSGNNINHTLQKRETSNLFPFFMLIGFFFHTCIAPEMKLFSLHNSIIMKTILTLLLSLSAICCFAQKKDTDQTHVQQVSPVSVVKAQLTAYNNRDLEAFLATLSNEVELYNFPNNLIGKGQELARKIYGDMFKNSPDLHCHIENRTVLGNTIIDHEKITGVKNREAFEVVTVYKVKGAKIEKVYFIR